MVITDNANTYQYMDCDQMIRAGADIKLTYLSKAAKFNFDKYDPSDYHYAK